MIRRVRILAFVLAVVMMLGAFAACDEPPSENSAGPGRYSDGEEAKSLTDNLTLAFSPMTLNDEYYAKVTQGFEDYCKDMKYDALVADPRNKAQEQYSEFENWIAMGVDGIAASPVDVLLLADVVTMAQESDIIVAGFFQEIPSADLNFVVDEFGYGLLIGENAQRWIDEKLGGRASVFLIGSDGTQGMLQRRKGVEKILSEMEGVHIVSSKSAETVDEAQKEAETVLAKYPNINVVICLNDEFALAALDVIKNLEVKNLKVKNEDYYVGGGGYTLAAVGQMNDAGSYLRSSVNLQPYQTGRNIAKMLAESIVNGAQGETVYFEMESYWQNLLGW